MTRVAVMIAGVIAMVAGATTSSWWAFRDEALGLRGARMCASCRDHAYDDSTFATLGTIAFYGAFVLIACAILAAVSWWRTAHVARRANHVVAVLAIAMLAVAVAFVMTRPDELTFSEGIGQRSRLFTHALAIGWSAIAYAIGAVVAAVGAVALDQDSRRRELRA